MLSSRPLTVSVLDATTDGADSGSLGFITKTTDVKRLVLQTGQVYAMSTMDGATQTPICSSDGP